MLRYLSVIVLLGLLVWVPGAPAMQANFRKLPGSQSLRVSSYKLIGCGDNFAALPDPNLHGDPLPTSVDPFSNIAIAGGGRHLAEAMILPFVEEECTGLVKGSGPAYGFVRGGINPRELGGSVYITRVDKKRSDGSVVVIAYDRGAKEITPPFAEVIPFETIWFVQKGSTQQDLNESRSPVVHLGGDLYILHPSIPSDPPERFPNWVTPIDLAGSLTITEGEIGTEFQCVLEEVGAPPDDDRLPTERTPEDDLPDPTEIIVPDQGPDATCRPVDLRTGFKFEEATDLTVKLNGRDFVLSRSYRSELDIFPTVNGSLPRSDLGPGWMVSSSAWLSLRDTVDVIGEPYEELDFIDGRLFGRQRFYKQPLSGNSRWLAEPLADAGQSLQVVPSTTRIVSRLDSASLFRYGDVDVETYVMTSPGGGEKIFLRKVPDTATSVGGMTKAQAEQSLVGRLIAERDSYGNQWTYHYQALAYDLPSVDDGSGSAVEDVDSDGVLDVDEDLDGDSRFDTAEDLDGDGNMDVNEDTIVVNQELDPGEDLDGDGRLDTQIEDVDGDGKLDGDEDLDGDGTQDVDEDTNGNGILDLGYLVRLRAIYLDSSGLAGPFPALSESQELSVEGFAAIVSFDWHGAAAPFQLEGRLKRAAVKRWNGTAYEETQSATYLYHEGATTTPYQPGLGGVVVHADVGTAGDLIQVVKSQRVDFWGAAGQPSVTTPGGTSLRAYEQVEQYRYHDGDDGPTISGTTLFGPRHGLKAVISPRSIEFVAGLNSSTSIASVVDQADDLLALSDVAALPVPANPTVPSVIDLASKWIGYFSEEAHWDAEANVTADYQTPATGWDFETSGDSDPFAFVSLPEFRPGRVRTQFTTSDSCGCGFSGAASDIAVRLDYAYVLWEPTRLRNNSNFPSWMSPNDESESWNRPGFTTRIVESVDFAGTSSFQPYRMRIHEFQRYEQDQFKISPTEERRLSGSLYERVAMTFELDPAQSPLSMDDLSDPSWNPPVQQDAGGRDLQWGTFKFIDRFQRVAWETDSSTRFPAGEGYTRWKFATNGNFEPSTYPDKIEEQVDDGTGQLTTQSVLDHGHAMRYRYDATFWDPAVASLVGGNPQRVLLNPGHTSIEVVSPFGSEEQSDREIAVLGRADLVSESGSPLTDANEYEYGFYDEFTGTAQTNEPYFTQVAWVVTRRPLDDNVENGPGGFAVSVDLFDTKGNLVWSQDAAGKTTYREYDAAHGGLLRVIENADPANYSSFSSFLLPPGGEWNPNIDLGIGEIVSSYEYDLLGRVIKQVSPDGTESYTQRLVVDPTAGPSPFLVNSTLELPVLCEVTFPFSDGGSFYNGPIVVSAMDASGRQVYQASFTAAQNSSYNPLAGVFSLDSEVSRAESSYGFSGLLEYSAVWPAISARLAGSLADADVTYYEYDAVGRLVRTIDPVGGVTQSFKNTVATEGPAVDNTSFDVLDRTSATYTTTLVNPADRTAGVHPPVIVTEMIYDDASAGNGLVTEQRMRVDANAANDRVTKFYYDDRDRLVFQENPEAPHVAHAYDTLGRRTATAIFSSVPADPTAVQVTSTTDRVSYSETSHGSRSGRVYRSRAAIDPTAASPEFLESHTWIDDVGRTIATWSPNAPVSKVEYDVLGRVTKSFVTDGYGMGIPGTAAAYTAASTVVGDRVLEQAEMEYEPATNRQLGVVQRSRLHDNDTATGELTAANSVTSYSYVVYDFAGRVSHSLAYGTNSSSDVFESGGVSPVVDRQNNTGSGLLDYAAFRVAHPDALISSTVFDNQGRVQQTWSPGLSFTMYKYDALSRQVAMIEAANQGLDFDAAVTWNSASQEWDVAVGLMMDDSNRVTSFVLDGLGRQVRRIAHLPASAPITRQVTEYVYGVSGAEAEGLHSAALLREIRYPQKASGSPQSGKPGTTDEYKVKFEYNRLGETTAMTDQRGVRHEYARDGLGRVTLDQVTTLPTGTAWNDPGWETAGRGFVFDQRGWLERVLTLDDTASLSGYVLNSADIRSEVRYDYYSNGAVRRLVQNPDGEVMTTGSGPLHADDYAVGYEMAEASQPQDLGMGNDMRVTGLFYPSEMAEVPWTTAPALGQAWPATATVANNYGAAASISSRIGRIESLDLLLSSTTDPSPVVATLAAYDHIGIDRDAIVSYPEIGMLLDRTVDEDGNRSAGTYHGYDKHGRLTKQMWIRERTLDGPGGNLPFQHVSGTGKPTMAPVFGRLYDYDDDSNRISDKDAIVEGGFTAWRSHQWDYTYDPLDRLENATVKVHDPASPTPSYSKPQNGSAIWDLDVLGNWREHERDAPTTPPAGFELLNPDFRTNDAATNELLVRTLEIQGATYAPLPFEYDEAGNMTQEGTSSTASTRRYYYDAWNQLVRVEQYHPGRSAYEPIELNSYNALGWRIAVEEISPAGLGLDQRPDDTRERRIMLYDQSWRLIEERIDDLDDQTDTLHTESSSHDNADRKTQLFWGTRYIDDHIAKRHDRFDAAEAAQQTPGFVFRMDGEWDASRGLYFMLTDAQFSVRAVVVQETFTDAQQTDFQWGLVEEWIDYTPYGEARFRYAVDLERDANLGWSDPNTDGRVSFAAPTDFSNGVSPAVTAGAADVDWFPAFGGVGSLGDEGQWSRFMVVGFDQATSAPIDVPRARVHSKQIGPMYSPEFV